METGVQTSSLPVTNSAGPCPPDVLDSSASLAAPREMAIPVGKRDKEVRSGHLGENVTFFFACLAAAFARLGRRPSWPLPADWQNVQHCLDHAILQAA